MDTHNTIQHSNTKRVIHTVLSTLVIVVAVALLAYMIAVEDELGALPLLLLVLGTGWLGFARRLVQPRHD